MTSNDTPHDDNEPRDTDIPGQISDVVRVQNRLRDHYKATYVDIDTDWEGVTIRLQFRGFDSLESALDRINTVATSLNNFAESPDVSVGVDMGGMYDRATGEHDDRPSAWVNATFNKRPKTLLRIDEDADTDDLRERLQQVDQ